ncbi:hypothetical protein COJ46_14355 [Bacillus sp. AFS077874]|nr:hypothetical protein CON00_08365 [Bacillus sp. AFS096315]PFM79457.1 hypothetical protein COJ46_14355 [Bacillus sp. AFS077874]
MFSIKPYHLILIFKFMLGVYIKEKSPAKLEVLQYNLSYRNKLQVSPTTYQQSTLTNIKKGSE